MSQMTHEQAQDKLLDLVYGELRGAEKADVHAHLDGCPQCQAELEKIAGTRRVMRALAPEPAPSHGEHLILTAAREAAKAAKPSPWLPTWIWGVAATTAVVLIVGGVTVSLLREPMRALTGASVNALAGEQDGPAARAPTSPPAAPPAVSSVAEAQEPPRELESQDVRQPAAPDRVAVLREEAKPEAKRKLLKSFAGGDGHAGVAQESRRGGDFERAGDAKRDVAVDGLAAHGTLGALGGAAAKGAGGGAGMAAGSAGAPAGAALDRSATTGELSLAPAAPAPSEMPPPPAPAPHEREAGPAPAASPKAPGFDKDEVEVLSAGEQPARAERMAAPEQEKAMRREKTPVAGAEKKSAAKPQAVTVAAAPAPDAPPALLDRARSELARGQLDLAEKEAQRALDLAPVGPSAPGALAVLAEIHERRGDPAGARALYARILEGFPASPQASRARAHLAPPAAAPPAEAAPAKADHR